MGKPTGIKVENKIKTIENGLITATLAALLGCASTKREVRLDSSGNDITYNTTIDVSVPENITIFVMPCRRAGVSFNDGGYTIICSDENYFCHEIEADYLRFAGVTYWDDNQDGFVDKLSVNEISVDVSDPSIDNFYHRKLEEFRKEYARKLWQNYLGGRNR